MVNHYPNLNPEKALIWRIVHRDNVPWLLDHDVQCAKSAKRDPNYVAIGNPELIDNRSRRLVRVQPGGTLGDYVPFYFTPFSPMMYNIFTGRGAVPQRPNADICILVFSLHTLKASGVPFVFTDRHAYLSAARFFNDVADLGKIDWPLLRARNFQRNPDDPEQIERYQAEALIHQQVPVKLMTGLVCHNDVVRAALQAEADARGLQIAVRARPHWYF